MSLVTTGTNVGWSPRRRGGGGGGGEGPVAEYVWAHEFASPGTASALSNRAGWMFTVGTSDLTVRSLRYYKSNTASDARVIIHRNSDDAVVAIGDITLAEAGWNTVDITPVTLTAGESYTISGRVTSGGLSLYRNPTGQTAEAGFTVDDSGVFGPADDARPTSASTSNYMPCANFEFIVNDVDESDYGTNFSEYADGAGAPTGWAQLWSTFGNTEIGSDITYEGGKRLWLRSGGNRYAAIAWNNPGVITDATVRLSLKMDTNTQYVPLLLWLRATGATGSESGYAATLADGTHLRISKMDAGVVTTLAEVAFAYSGSIRYRMVFEAEGTNLRAKVWADGDAEPADWMVTTTDADYADGAVAVGTYTASVNLYLDTVSVDVP